MTTPMPPATAAAHLAAGASGLFGEACLGVLEQARRADPALHERPETAHEAIDRLESVNATLRADLARVTADGAQAHRDLAVAHDMNTTAHNNWMEMRADRDAHKARADAAEFALSVERERGDGYLAGMEGKPEPLGLTDLGLDAFIRADRMRERMAAAEALVEKLEAADAESWRKCDAAEAKAERLAAALRELVDCGLDGPDNCIACGCIPHWPNCPLQAARAALSPITPAPVAAPTMCSVCGKKPTSIGGMCAPCDEADYQARHAPPPRDDAAAAGEADGFTVVVAGAHVFDAPAADRDNSAPREAEVGVQESKVLCETCERPAVHIDEDRSNPWRCCGGLCCKSGRDGWTTRPLPAPVVAGEAHNRYRCPSGCGAPVVVDEDECCKHCGEDAVPYLPERRRRARCHRRGARGPSSPPPHPGRAHRGRTRHAGRARVARPHARPDARAAVREVGERDQAAEPAQRLRPPAQPPVPLRPEGDDVTDETRRVLEECRAVVFAAAALGDRGAREALTNLDALLAAPVVEWAERPDGSHHLDCEGACGNMRWGEGGCRAYIVTHGGGRFTWWVRGDHGTAPTLDAAKAAALAASGRTP